MKNDYLRNRFSANSAFPPDGEYLTMWDRLIARVAQLTKTTQDKMEIVAILEGEYDLKEKEKKKSYIDVMMPRIKYWLTHDYADHSAKEEIIANRNNAKYMTVNNSSCHMSLFPKFHTNLVEVIQQISAEELDPMTYSDTSVVWDILDNKAIYVWHDMTGPLVPTEQDWTVYNKESAEKIQAEMERHAEIEKRKAEAEAQRKMAIEIRDSKINKEKHYAVYVQMCLAQVPEPLTPVSFWDFDPKTCMTDSKINVIATDIEEHSTEKYAKEAMASEDATWERFKSVRKIETGGVLDFRKKPYNNYDGKPPESSYGK